VRAAVAELETAHGEELRLTHKAAAEALRAKREAALAAGEEARGMQAASRQRWRAFRGGTLSRQGYARQGSSALSSR
jgi:hypothetical protein